MFERSKLNPVRRARKSYRLLLAVFGFVVLTGLGGGIAFWFRDSVNPRPLPSLLGPKPDKVSIQFVDVTPQSGITFRHTHGGFGEQYIVEAMSAGLAVFDYDGDDWDDLYFLNGVPLPLGSFSGPLPCNGFYRNLGGFRFWDAAAVAGVADTGYGLGVTAGDYDNDGFSDLYLNNFGPNVLYRNNGDGTFADVTQQAGVADGFKVGAGACFLDIDADGDLDLYSANYVEFAYDANPRRVIGGFARAPSPLDFKPVPDTLFRNEGDGTFTDISAWAGIAEHAGTGMGMVASDCDGDGDTDIFVCNDVRPNFLWINDGFGRFAECGLECGTAYDHLGKANGSMGVDAADYDNDGHFDFYMTSYQGEHPVLYRNLGGGLFEDITVPAGAGNGCLQHVNWGCGFADFDLDGFRDLFVANGHLEEFIDQIDPTTAYRAPNVVLRNKGMGKFENVSAVAGPGMSMRAASRGIGLDDLDNDGDIDVAILNAQEHPTLLRNDSPRAGSWLQLRLIGTRANRDAVGSQVTLVGGNFRLIDEVHSGRGYQSHWGMRLYFGLGKENKVDRLEIRWLGGAVTALTDLPTNGRILVIEGWEKPLPLEWVKP